MTRRERMTWRRQRSARRRKAACDAGPVRRGRISPTATVTGL